MKFSEDKKRGAGVEVIGFGQGCAHDISLEDRASLCKRLVAWTGNRTRASRVAGENSTTEPSMRVGRCAGKVIGGPR